MIQVFDRVRRTIPTEAERDRAEFGPAYECRAVKVDNRIEAPA